MNSNQTSSRFVVKPTPKVRKQLLVSAVALSLGLSAFPVTAAPLEKEWIKEEAIVVSVDSEVSQVAAFVDRLYEIALGREADEQGKEDWVDTLVEGKIDIDAARVAWGFIGSTEYSQKNRSNEDYLEDLYHIFLDRESDAGGKQSWLNIMDTGVSRKYIANKFAKSAEFSQICQDYGVERGGIPLTEMRDLHQKASAMVTAHYRACLGRMPSAQEINGWIADMLDGYASDLVYGVFHSTEYADRGCSDEEFVNHLYQALLMRTADAGSQGWIEKLKNKVSRDEVIKGFIQSGEFQSICANASIEPFLRHPFPRAVEVLDKVGWNLKAAFNWSAGMTHIRDTSINPATPENGSVWFANYGYDHYKGNCFVKAGTFYQMAIEMGYNARHVYGRIPREGRADARHSWVEIDIDGQTYVFDPSRKDYYFKYGTPGTWVYILVGEVPQ